ncbi:MAG: phytoene desaturase [Pseudomonadota bacterium]|nr:phytoene desaturase [Pseudomonadota bacterium]
MKKVRAAVVGSGFGGLALAIRLQSLGYETSIFEKRDLPGGRAYVFKDKGFTFDAGPTVITAPECLEELFALSGRKMSDYVEMIPISPFYRLYWESGYHFDYSNDDTELKRQILAKHPQDWDGYQRFMKYTKDVFREGYEKLAHVPFPNFWSMIKVAPQLVQLSAFRSVYSMVSKYIKDEELRQAFSFHSLLVGGNPFTSSSIYTLIHYLERNWGVFFPRGGTGALVRGLVKLFTDLGGKIHYNSEIDEILTDGQKVMGLRLKNGHSEHFDLVASNADVAHTYSQLLRNEKQVKNTRKYIMSRSFSMSLFLIYFGTDKTYPHLKHHNVMFGPRYKALLADIFKAGNLSDDFSLYLHAPCRTDASLAPEGCDAFYVLSPVPHLGKNPMDWKKEGPVYADKILDYLSARYLPNLKKHIVTQRIFTPVDFETELNSQFGSAFSLEPILTQSAYFRTQNREKKIKGLYFVGAGTHPGAGVPGVVNSAKATTGVILADGNLA